MHFGSADQLLLAELFGLAAMVLALFRGRRWVGLTPLYVTLGVFQPVQVVLSSSIYVEVMPGVQVSPGTLMFAASLLAILLVYIREDAAEVRKVVYGIMGANLAMTLVMYVVSVQLRTPGTANFLALAPAIFSQGARVTAVGSVVLLLDVLLLISLYTGLRHLLPHRPFSRVLLTLTGVLVFDALAFTTGVFLDRPDYLALLAAAVASKVAIALGFSAALIGYLKFIEPRDAGSDRAEGPLRDFFYAFTYREKFELETLRSDEAESRLEKAQEVARMGFLDWHLDTDQIYWSDQMVRLMGLPAGGNQQTLESTVAMVHPGDRAQAQASIGQAVSGGPGHSIDHRMVRADGSVIWVHAEGELLDYQEGNRKRFLGTLVDITQRKLAEERILQLNEELEARVLQRTRQLEVANKELESFSYSVSHDLRAPLRAVSGFAQIIARRHRDALNEEGRRYADNIVSASERMSRLIDELLDYSKLGRRALKLGPVALTEVLRHVGLDVAGRVAEQGATLQVAADLPVVLGEATLLGQVFGNLVENALTYRDPAGPATVAITWETDGGRVLVHVADQGIGIPGEHLEKIFNVFQRLHNDDLYPGTGIGLAVVQKSLALLGGEVRVQSEPGKGSMFTVDLPAYAVENA